jgi:phospholipid/cholesterol/gamma-HCH transport system substrate-binding protein
VGNKIINISPSLGNSPAPLVENQDVIQSYSRLATADMLEVLGKTNENIALFSLQLLRISEKINTGSGTLNRLLQDSILATDLGQTVANLKYTTHSLRGMATEMQQSLVNLNEGDGLLHDLLYDTTVMADLQTLSGSLKQLLDQKVEPLFTDIQQSTVSIAQASDALNEMLQQIKAGEGTLGSLLQDEDMETDLKQTLANINQSAQRFNENMEAMRHNFLFKGYFKKLEKQERKSLKK